MTSEPHPDARRKLTDEQVREIRYLAKRPCPTCDAMPSLASLARKFGVSTPTVLAIVERRAHRAVPDRRATPRPTGTPDVQRLDAAAEFLRKNEIPFAGTEALRFAAEILVATASIDGPSAEVPESDSD